MVDVGYFILVGDFNLLLVTCNVREDLFNFRSDFF